ncbi:hypothetical protein ACGFI9_35820 [Micromonospora sp. NPDC048930]|uniref:hypothetical protein n=1 Tax=Micromonospora sp. NPDC048930 TaxID=3364261 RepID=UPI00371CD169
MIKPNTVLSGARQRLPSRMRPGQRMSRSELADAVNAALDRIYSGRDLTAHYVNFRWVGKLEATADLTPAGFEVVNVYRGSTSVRVRLRRPKPTPAPRADTA